MAALLADFEPGLDPSQEQIKSLRATLGLLAAQASEQELSDENLCCSIGKTSTTTDSTSYLEDTTTSESNFSASASSYNSFSSPLGFLQAVLPHIPTERLKEALGGESESENGDIDMEAVVERLLSSENVRELKERGLDELGAIDGVSWKTKKKTPKSPTKRKAMKVQTMTLNDVLQKQHTRPAQTSGRRLSDPWTQLSSLATHVASFLPPHPPSFFLSYLHDPNYSSPSAALRAAINSVSESTISSPDPARTSILYGILDIIQASPQYEYLTSEQKSILMSDTQISLSATQGRGEDAHDLVWFLYELDRDKECGDLGMGIYHSSPPSTPGSSKSPAPWTNAPLSPHSSPPQPPPPPAPEIQHRQPQTREQTKGQNEWQTIPVRKPPQSYTHAAFIPSANPSNGRRLSLSQIEGGNTYGKGGKGDVGELDTRWKIQESVRKRDELLRQAAGAWKSGSKKSRGGEIAAYFAERAREFQELARKEQLENARMMVESKMYVKFSLLFIRVTDMPSNL